MKKPDDKNAYTAFINGFRDVLLAYCTRRYDLPLKEATKIVKDAELLLAQNWKNLCNKEQAAIFSWMMKTVREMCLEKRKNEPKD